MQSVLLVLYTLVALLLVGVILIQQPKNSAGLFSGAGQSLLGTGSKTFMTKFTTTLAAVFMLLCLILAILPRNQGPKSEVSDLLQKQQQEADQSAARNASAAAQAVTADKAPAPSGAKVPAPSSNAPAAPAGGDVPAPKGKPKR